MFNIVKETKRGDVITHKNITSPRYAANLAEALTRHTGIIHKVEGFEFDYVEDQVKEILYELSI